MSVKYNPDVFKLGITYSHAIDFIDALETAHSCGTHTLMVCCDNEYFRLPTDAMLDGYNLVIHGPLSINLANSNLQIRKNSVKRKHNQKDSILKVPSNGATYSINVNNAKDLRDEAYPEIWKNILDTKDRRYIYVKSSSSSRSFN